MTVTTVYCTAETGGIGANANNGNFTNALSGAGSESWSDNQAWHWIGNFWHTNNRANIYYMFLEFDLSVIPGTDTVSDADFQVYGRAKETDVGGYSILLGELANAVPWDNTDWLDGTDLTNLTDLAGVTDTAFSTTGYNTWNSASLTTVVDNKASSARFVLWSSNTENTTWPAMQPEYDRVEAYSYGQSGTTQDPKIVVTHAATSSDTDVAVDLAAITITTHQADIVYDVEVAADLAAITLTTHPATISFGVNVDAQTAALQLTPHPAVITYDVDVQADTAALTLTTHPATIEVGTNVQVQTAALTIETRRATIVSPSSNVDVEVASAQLVFTMYPARIDYLTAPIFPKENRMTATVAANIHTSRVDKIPPHTAVVVEDEFTYKGVL